MTNDPPPMPPPGDSGSGDEIDFGALVAEHSEYTRAKARGGRRGNGDGTAPADAAAAPGEIASSRGAKAESETGRAPAAASRTKRSDSKWWRVGYPAVIVLLVLLVPVLVWSGLRVILDSTDGQLVKRVTDPTAPGYEAVVEKTPTALVALTGPDNQLDSVAVLALTAVGAGGILAVPAGTTLPTQYGPIPMSTYYANSGIDGLSAAVGDLLNLSFAEPIVVPSTEWASLTAPYAPIPVTTPDPVRDSKDVVVFQKGNLDLKPDQVWPFLSNKGSKESDLNRLVRQEAFWKGWLGKVKSDSIQYPGSVTSGLGRFVSTLARGQVSISTLPVVSLLEVPAGSPPLYAVQKQAAQDAVAAIIPFPDGAPGSRPRVRVLDGTGQLGNGISAAIVLAAAGAQIDVVGNSRAFDAATTQFIYYEGTSEATVKQLRDALGIGEIVESKQSNSATDITVVLGQDYLAVAGPSAGSQNVSNTGGTS
jgi:hypothetical protein